jgi:hypothetical protein
MHGLAPARADQLQWSTLLLPILAFTHRQSNCHRPILAVTGTTGGFPLGSRRVNARRLQM